MCLLTYHNYNVHNVQKHSNGPVLYMREVENEAWDGVLPHTMILASTAFCNRYTDIEQIPYLKG